MINYRAFKQLVRVLSERASQPTYVSVKPDLTSRESLAELAETIGLPSHLLVAESEMHATVTYSREPISDPTKIVEGFMPIEAVGDDLHFFTSRKDGKYCLVLKLSSVGLRGLHEAIKKTGASHDFPTFEAHVTLCYDTPGDIRKAVESHPKPVSVPLKFTSFEVKPLDPDRKPS